MRSLAQLQVRDAEKQRQSGCDNAQMIESQKWAATGDACDATELG